MGSAEDAPPARLRAGFWLIVVGTASCGLIGAATILWRWLPMWAPSLVLDYSPWVEPALRAEVRQYGGKLYHRIRAWGKSATPALIAALENQNPEVRVVAAVGLEELRDRSSTTSLIHTLDDGDESVRNSASRALRALHDPDSLSALSGHLARHDVTTDIEVAYAIANLYSPHVVDHLLPCLSSSIPYERGIACLALTKSRDPRAVPWLTKLLGKSRVEPKSYPPPFDGAASALGRTIGIEAVAAIDAALRDPDPGRRAAAAAAVIFNDAAELLPPVLALARDPDLTVRTAAGQTYVHLHQPEVLVAMGAILDGGGKPAIELVLSLGNFQYPGNVRLLNHHVRHPETEVRLAIISVLSNIMDVESKNALVAMIDDPNDAVRKRLHRALSSALLSPEQRARFEQMLPPASPDP